MMDFFIGIAALTLVCLFFGSITYLIHKIGAILEAGLLVVVCVIFVIFFTAKIGGCVRENVWPKIVGTP